MGKEQKRFFFLACVCREKVRFSSGRVEQVLKVKPGRVKPWVLRGPNKAGMALQTRATWIQGSVNLPAVPRVSFQELVLPCQSDPEKQTVCAGSRAKALLFLSLFLSPSATCSPDAHN